MARMEAHQARSLFSFSMFWDGKCRVQLNIKKCMYIYIYLKVFIYEKISKIDIYIYLSIYKQRCL